MEPKKTKKADLERKRGLFLEIGMVTVLGLLVIAFEWGTQPTQTQSFQSNEEANFEEELIENTFREEPKQAPPPAPPPVTVELEIVENDADLDDDIDIDMEDDQSSAMAISDFSMEEEEEEEEEIFMVVEEQPEFPGGYQALRKYLAENIEYPEVAAENQIQGTVYIQFVVTSNGNVEKAKVVRGVDRALDKEALRVVNSMPNWKPGKQRGKAVSVWYTVPIKFVLN